MTKNRVFYVIGFTLFLCIFFVIGEVSIRILKPQKTYSELLELVNDMWAPSEFHKWELKRHYKGKYPSIDYPGKYVTITTNNLGLRDDHDITYEKPKDKKRILIIGDSFTYGWGVETTEAYPHALEHILEKLNPNYEVIKAGFPAFNTDDEYVWLKDEGIKFKPDIIIYQFYGGNDLYVSRNYWILDSDGLPVKINKNVKLPQYVDRFGRKRDNADFVMAEDTVGYEYIYKIPVLRESHFFIALGKAIEKTYRHFGSKINPAKTYELPQGFTVGGWTILFGEDSYRFRNKYKKFYELTSRFTPTQEEGETFFHELVLGMNKIAKDINSDFIVLMIPTSFQVEPDYYLPLFFKEPDENKAILEGTLRIRRDFIKEFSTYLKNHNIEYINLLDEMKARPGRYFPDTEVHFNVKGHEFTAEVIYEYLAKNNYISKNMSPEHVPLAIRD